MSSPDIEAKMNPEQLLPLNPKVSEYRGQPVRYLQDKLDGHRITVIRDEDRIRVLSKGKSHDIASKLEKCPVIWSDILDIPSDSIVFAELYANGIPATNVPTLINEGSDLLRLGVFAVPLLNGVDYRADDFSEIISICEYHGLFMPKVRILSFSYEPISLSEKHVDELRTEAMERGIEGFVVKEAHWGKWYKIKPTRSADFFVWHTQISTSATQSGGLKCIKIGLYDENGKFVDMGSVGSGFDLEYRMSVDPATLIDRVCEVKFDSVAGAGKLRFPRFVRWRDGEKSKEECTTDQL